MNIPVNIITWAAAFLPIAVLVVLMLGFNWGAKKAAPVGLVITMIIALVLYKATPMLVLIESIKGAWSSVTILLIVWTAILMYQVGNEANAFLVIRNGMKKLLPNELIQILAMGWIIEAFLQGITGFGVPVAVGAPLLIGIGVQPLWAVIIPLFGQAFGNTFGTLGGAWDSLAMSAGLAIGSAEYFETALWTAGFLCFWNTIAGFAMCWFYGKGEAIRKGLPAVLIIAAIQGGGQLVLSQINTTICNFVPAVVSMVAIFAVGRMGMYNTEWRIESSPIMDRSLAAANAAGKAADAKEESTEAQGGMNLVQAFIPYFLLSAITLAVLLIKPLNTALGSFSIGFAFPETSTGYGYVNAASAKFSPIAIFTHASMFLLISSLIGLAYYISNGWIKEGGTARIFKKSFDMTMPSAIAVLCLVMMSKVMDGSGQTQVLANGIAGILGKAYLLLAPFVGMLGTFMTGSNMSSNILFGGFQTTTAELLGAKIPPVLGAQSSGGAIGSAISPSKIILGTTTANIAGKEGEVMKKLIGITMAVTIMIGAALFVVAV